MRPKTQGIRRIIQERKNGGRKIIRLPVRLGKTKILAACRDFNLGVTVKNKHAYISPL